MMWLVALLLPLVTANSHIDRFPTVSDSTVLKNVVCDNTTGQIFIGSINWVYVLDSNLLLKKAISIGPNEDSLDCPPDPTENCEATGANKRMQMDSTIIGMTIDQRNKLVIVCSNRYYGYCFKISIESLTVVLKVYTPIASNTEPPLLFVGPGFRPEGVLYVGTTHGIGLSLYNNRVPMLSVRELDRFNVAHVDLTTASYIDISAEFRETFAVRFVHGFTHGIFTYFLIVRREDPSKDYYTTKIIRICQKDKRFKSYIEMPIKCGVYSLLQDAYVGKPGKALGQTLGLSATDDVIFGTFASSLDGSRKVGRDSAVCVYSMAAINTLFLDSIKYCFAGQAKIGPAHLTTSLPCTRMVSVLLSCC